MLDIDRVIEAVEDNDDSGFCLACGAESRHCESDARNYPCEVCGARRVFAAQEVLSLITP